ncbi:MAG TPA: Ppx/GppA phosphatase family protein [Thermodesulfobacteriota bacterium]|nr:Ppx/GppA phosphatase family protein [Thermodesulfobacteriota bacterium]
MRIASIDIGTNTFRLLVTEPGEEGDSLHKLYVGREITRLGEGSGNGTRLIKPGAIERSLKALSGFSEIIRDLGVEKMRAVATSMVRESRNGLDFVNLVKSQTGLPVEVISGEEEALLTVSGVMKSVTFDTPDCLIFDIGGGSTEYIYVKEGAVTNLTSTRLGVVCLTERFLSEEKESEAALSALGAHIEKTLSEGLSGFPAGGEWLTVIGTAGTPTSLAAVELDLVKYDANLVNNYTLTRDGIVNILDRILCTPRAERAAIPGLEKGREDLIVSGTEVVLKTLDRFSVGEMVVSDAGLLEGVAYGLLA